MEKAVYLNQINQSKSFFDWVCLFALFFSAFASIASDSMNIISLYGVIPVVFLFCVLKEKTIFVNRYETTLILLYIWVCISSAWAIDTEYSMRELKSILGAFLLTSIFSIQARRQKMLPGLYISFLLLYIGAWYYASQNLLVITDFAGHERASDAKLNANTLAYYTFFVTFALFMLAELFKSNFWSGLFRIVFIAMVPVSFFVALTTASRQVLIIQIPLIALLLWIRYLQGGKKKTKFVFITVTVIAILLLLPEAISIFQDSYLAERSQASVEDDSRVFLMKDAIRVGYEHFPIGVGAGNYQKYAPRGYISHNTFTELFANTGVVGFFLFAYLMFTFVIRQWLRYRKTKDKTFAYFLIFGLFYMLDQFFFVFHNHLWLMSFFILVATHSETYYRYYKLTSK